MHLNSATAGDLDALDGIGPSLAERIVAYRVAHGGFRSVDELDEVSGIGPVRLEELRPPARAVTAGVRVDDVGVAAAPWLALGLALPALADSGALGRALVVLALLVLAAPRRPLGSAHRARRRRAACSPARPGRLTAWPRAQPTRWALSWATSMPPGS